MSDETANTFHYLTKLARETAQNSGSSKRQQIDAAWAAADADPNRRYLLPGEAGAGTQRWGSR